VNEAFALLSHWSFDPQVVALLLLAGYLYWQGLAATTVLLPRGHHLLVRPWRIAAFYGGLLCVLVALESPLDYYSHFLMWVHMVQHLVLIMAAAPLLLLGQPALPLLRGIPVLPRRRAMGHILSWPWLGPLNAVFRFISRPWMALLLFGGTFYIWHWPAFYNETLRSPFVHSLEHALFFGTALLFWLQIVDQTGFRPRMSFGRRSLYLLAAAVQNHVLAIVLAFSTTPLYAYANLASRPGNISAMADQQLAGGIMWVPGVMLYGSVMLYCLYRWLTAEEQAQQRREAALFRATTTPAVGDQGTIA